MSTSNNGESTYRIYWKHWAVTNNTSSATHEATTDSPFTTTPSTTTRSNSSSSIHNRRSLITSSAAVRITHETRAQDVLSLLGESATIRAAIKQAGSGGSGSGGTLVLIGTLYSLPSQFVCFENNEFGTTATGIMSTEQYPPPPQPPLLLSSISSSSDVSVRSSSTSMHPQRSPPSASSLSLSDRNTLTSLSSEPVHVVRTLQSHDHPVHVIHQLMDRLHALQERGDADFLSSSLSSLTVSPSSRLQQTTTEKQTIRSKLQLFVVHPALHNPVIELDGYCTGLDEEEEEDESESETGTEGRTDESRDNQQSRLEDHMFRQFPWLLSEESTTSISIESQTKNSNEEINPQVQLQLPSPTTLLGRSGSTGGEGESVRPLLRSSLRFPQPSALSLYGYLLKRSNTDVNVWRRVYCVLTDEALFISSRIYHHHHHHHHNNNFYEEGSNVVDSDAFHHVRRRRRKNDGRRGARRSRIELLRALLIAPPSHSSLPIGRGTLQLSNTETDTHGVVVVSPPVIWSFELISSTGWSFVFRTTTKPSFQLWMSSLHARIQRAQDDSYIHHAQLIMSDESIAKSKRMIQSTVRPFWETLLQTQQQQRSSRRRRSTSSLSSVDSDSSVAFDDELSLGPVSSRRGPVGMVLRWALEVADYRDACKYLHCRLPPKHPVVHQTAPHSSSNSLTSSSSSSIGGGGGSSHNNINSNNEVIMAPLIANAREALEPHLVCMIGDCWDQAHALLARASHLGRLMMMPPSPTSSSLTAAHIESSSPQQQPTVTALALQPSQRSSLSSIETHCRHVEYILTGCFRPLHTTYTHGGEKKNNHRLPNSSLMSTTSTTGSGVAIMKSSHGEQRNSLSKQQQIKTDPPPIDLFDALLEDLQNHASR